MNKMGNIKNILLISALTLLSFSTAFGQKEKKEKKDKNEINHYGFEIHSFDKE